MKKSYYFLFFFFFPAIIQAAGLEPVRTTSTLNRVTVFEHSAELHAKAEVQLPAGNRDIIITGVPITILTQTIQVSGFGDFTILSVQYHTNFLQHRTPDADVKRMQDSLELLDIETRKLQNTKSVLEGMANVIEANKNVAGTTTGLNADAYQKTLDIYLAKMTKIKDDLLTIDIALTRLNKKTENLKKELVPYPDVATGEIIVSISTKAPTKADLDISYVVSNAGWTPEYDVRCTGINQPLSIMYKAKVFQACGMDWNNVKLTINTGNPNQSANGPQLMPWYLNVYSTGYKRLAVKDINSMSAQPAGVQQRDKNADINTQGSRDYNTKYVIDGKPVAQNAFDNTQVELSPVSIEYAIDAYYTIPSDNSPHTVEMQSKTIPIYYQYAATPKLDKDAFLNAYIVRWDTLNLIPGTANIFFMGSYMGQSAVFTDNTSDTLALSLGRDKSIVIKRTALNNMTRTKFFSEKTSKTFGFDISVRNTRNQPINIKLYDQLPLSSNSLIEVTDTSYEGGKLEPATGKVEWNLTVKGNEEKKVNLSFTIKYPKGLNVTGL